METGQKIIQKNNNISQSKYNALSIQVSLSGLCFSILNSETNTITFLKRFNFNKKLNPNETLDKLRHHFNTIPELKQEFSNVIVIHKNELATLVPKPLFDADNLSDYLKFNSKILKTDYITFDQVELNDAANVFIPYVNINNYLYDCYGEFSFHHHSTILLKQIILTEKNASLPKMYVNVEDNSFEVIIIEEGKIKFYNSFEYLTKEDFIYYILFTAEQTELNPETFQLIFTGNLNSKDDLFIIAEKYIRFVFFGKRQDNFKYATDAQPKSDYSDFVILSSF